MFILLQIIIRPFGYKSVFNYEKSNKKYRQNLDFFYWTVDTSD